MRLLGNASSNLVCGSNLRFGILFVTYDNFMSSNVNEVIRAFNSLFFVTIFLLRKDFLRTKSTTSTKTQSSKSTKRCKRTEKKMRLKVSRGKKSHLFAYLHFCAFYTREEKKIEKREKSPQCKCTKYRCPHN